VKCSSDLDLAHLAEIGDHCFALSSASDASMNATKPLLSLT
jgi:hypothetical protein